jgi:2-methylcitrate dehydratase
VQAALQLHPQVRGRFDEIERITIFMADRPFVRDQQADLDRRYPQSKEAADHSFTFLPAVALLDGELTLRQFENDSWNEPSVRRLMQAISLEVAPDLSQRAPDAMPSRVCVLLRGGEEFVAQCIYPPGHSGENGLDGDVVIAKFQAVAKRMLGPLERQAVIDNALGLDAANCIDGLMALLACKAGNGLRSARSTAGSAKAGS